MWIEIADRNEHGALAVGLPRVLEALGGDLGVMWSILDMEARAESQVLGRDVLQLEREIREAAIGLVVSWGDLVRPAEEVSEFIDLTIAGCVSIDIIPRTLDDNALARCEVVLEPRGLGSLACVPAGSRGQGTACDFSLSCREGSNGRELLLKSSGGEFVLTPRT